MLRKQSREANFGDENFSNTQPDLALSIGQIVNKLQSGQTIPQTEMPVYLGDAFQEMVGFENLTKLEQIDFAREFRNKAQKAMDEEENRVKVARQKDTEIKAEEAAIKAAEAILQKQAEASKKL